MRVQAHLVGPAESKGVAGEFTAATLRQALGASLKAITVGPSLLVFLDRAKQAEFMRRWEQDTGVVR